MSNVLPPDASFEEGIRNLIALSKERGDDWRVKVARRPSETAMSESIAIFDDARVEHFTAAETWLPALCGGGPYFLFSISHAKQREVLVQILHLPKISGEPRPVDPSVVGRPNWTGPGTLVYPLPQKPADRGGPVEYGYRIPSDSPGVPERGAASQTDHATVGGDAGRSFFLAELQRRDTEIRQREVALTEERRRADLAQMESRHAADFKRLEAMLASLAETVKVVATRPVEQPRPAPSILEQATPLMPVILKFLDRGEADRKAQVEREAADRRLQMELDAKREEREAREREAREKREAAMQERISNQGAETSKILASMGEVVSSSMRAQLQSIATLQELMQPPQQEEGLIGVLKEGIRAFAEFASVKAQADAQKAGATPGQPALPAAPAAPTPTPLEDEEEVPLDQAEPEEIMQEIIRQLQAHSDSKALAGFYVEALRTNPGFGALVKNSGGTINAFQARLGTWPTEAANLNYLKEVLAAVQVAAAPFVKKQPAATATVPAQAAPTA